MHHNLLPYDGEVYLLKDIVNSKELAQWFAIVKKLNWQTETIRMFGKHITVPRLIYFCGDDGIDYRYSGLPHHCHGWPAELNPIKQSVEQHSQQQFNFLLGNLYRDGNDYMGWHDDNEKSLGINPVIGSLSFGAARRFDLRHKESKEKVSIMLEHGSLLIMRGETQAKWQHRLAKAKDVNEARYNFTFRFLL